MVRCAACSTELVPGARFCSQCGRPVAGPAAARPPLRVAEHIVASVAAREGERKHVTVLFADLKGSLELLADRDPEDARHLLDPVLERMIDAVRRYEGTVNQVLGDGVMALFGAPLAQEDHAVRACYAALAMQGAVGAYAREVQRSEGVPIQIRVGLNSGEVVARSIDSDLHLEYSAVGPTTHLAARMEQMALPGSILATAHTLRLAEGYVEARALGPVRVRGLGDPIEVHEITGASRARSRLEVARARGLTRFVGRETELTRLRTVIDDAVRGSGHTVMITGEAGVGKSRLLHQLVQGPELCGWMVLEAAAPPYGRAAGYLPVVELLRRYFGIDEEDEPHLVREKVAGKLLALDEDLKDILPPVLALLDATPEEWRYRALEAAQRRRQTLDAVARLVVRESRRRPLLLLVEDLHWADDESLEVLDAVAERLAGCRAVLLLSARHDGPDRRHPRADVEIRLDPLPPATAASLLDALLGDDGGLEGLKRALIERTTGNPLFLEETVRALVETGTLVGPRGGRRLMRAPDRLEMPATVQALLAARIDRLPVEDKRLLQTAAVIGTEVPAGLLRVVAELPADRLGPAVARLEAAELLHHVAVFPDPEYHFRHALIQDVAYRSMVQERRRTVHAAVVEAMLRLDPRAPERQADRLAHHAYHGELWEEAVTYLRRAGARAAARSAHAEAIGRLEQALAAIERLPRRRETVEDALAIRLDLRRALLPLGRPDRILDHLARAAELAEELGDPRELARVSALRANHFWWVGEPEHAIAAADRALGLARDVGDFTLETTARFYRGQALHALGRYGEAVACFRAVVDAAEREIAGGRLRGLAPLFFGAWLVRCLLELGAMAEARAHVERAASIAAASDAPHAAIAACHGRGLLGVHGHEREAGIAALERARALAETVRIPVLTVTTDLLLGRSHTLAGTPARGLPLLAAAAERAQDMRMLVDQALGRAWLADARLALDQVAAAEADAAAAVAAARRHRERGNEAYALLTRAAIQLRSGRSEIALADLGEARRLAEALEMRAMAETCDRIAADVRGAVTPA